MKLKQTVMPSKPTQKQILEAGIKTLTDEKRREVTDRLRDAAMAINGVELLLRGTELQTHSLLDGQKHLSLWCQLYDLKQMFKKDE